MFARCMPKSGAHSQGGARAAAWTWRQPPGPLQAGSRNSPETNRGDGERIGGKEDWGHKEMRRTKPSVIEGAPFLFMGVLCWLCGAVVVGLAAQLLFGWVSAAIAVVVLTAVVLAAFWSLSNSAYVSKR